MKNVANLNQLETSASVQLMLTLLNRFMNRPALEAGESREVRLDLTEEEFEALAGHFRAFVAFSPDSGACTLIVQDWGKEAETPNTPNPADF